MEQAQADRVAKIAIVIGALVFVGYAIFIGGLVYTVAHFVAKEW